jgi:hypothetical protein
MTQPLLTPREHRVKAMLLRARNPNSRAAQFSARRCLEPLGPGGITGLTVGHRAKWTKRLTGYPSVFGVIVCGPVSS